MLHQPKSNTHSGIITRKMVFYSKLYEIWLHELMNIITGFFFKYIFAVAYLEHFAGQLVINKVIVVTTPLLSILEAVLTVSPSRQ